MHRLDDLKSNSSFNTKRRCLFVFQGDVEEDEHIADKESDIKPRFHRAKSHTQKHTDPASGDGAGGDSDDEYVFLF